MTPAPWYFPLLYVWWSIAVWLPVPIRLGKLNDLKAYRTAVHTALDHLERGGDQGANMARSYLYSVIEDW